MKVVALIINFLWFLASMYAISIASHSDNIGLLCSGIIGLLASIAVLIFISTTRK